MINVLELFSEYIQVKQNSAEICREFVMNFLECYIIDVEYIGNSFTGKEFDSVVSSYYNLSSELIFRLRQFRNRIMHYKYYIADSDNIYY